MGVCVEGLSVVIRSLFGCVEHPAAARAPSDGKTRRMHTMHAVMRVLLQPHNAERGRGGERERRAGCEL